MTEIPQWTTPPVKCGFCGRVMDIDEWTTSNGGKGHQYCHGADCRWAHTPENIRRQREHDAKIASGEIDR